MDSSVEEAVAHALHRHDADALVEALAALLSCGHNSKSTLSILCTGLRSRQSPPDLGLLLTVLQKQFTEKDYHRPFSTIICNMVLDAMSQCASEADLEAMNFGAVALFEGTMCSVGTTSAGSRLLAKLASIFHLNSSSLTDLPATAQYVSGLLLEASTVQPAVDLMMQFKGLDNFMEIKTLLRFMVLESYEELAETWAASLGKEYQIFYVQECIANDQLKSACRAVRLLDLQQHFPDIEEEYKHASMARLVRKRMWPVAFARAEEDVALQTFLLEEMVALGEVALAEEFRMRLRLPVSVLGINQSEVEAEAKRRAETYLQLEVPLGSVVIVDSGERLQEAAAHLSSATVLGLDVEWRPSPAGRSRKKSNLDARVSSDARWKEGLTETESSPSSSDDADTQGDAFNSSSPASILQVGTADRVYLFDLVNLREDPVALSGCLETAFTQESTLILGFEIRGDLNKLAVSYPAVKAFQRVNHVFDLKDLWHAYQAQMDSRPSALMQIKKRSVGLSTLATQLLGKPLDKSMQVSNWEQRPLTQRQIIYSAQDAHVLLRILDQFKSVVPTSAEVIKSKAFTFETGQDSTSKKKPGHKSDGHDDEDSGSSGGPPSVGGSDSSDSLVSSGEDRDPAPPSTSSISTAEFSKLGGSCSSPAPSRGIHKFSEDTMGLIQTAISSAAQRTWMLLALLLSLLLSFSSEHARNADRGKVSPGTPVLRRWMWAHPCEADMRDEIHGQLTHLRVFSFASVPHKRLHNFIHGSRVSSIRQPAMPKQAQLRWL